MINYINLTKHVRGGVESDWLAKFLLKEFTLIEDGKSSALRCPGKRTYDSCLHCLTDFESWCPLISER